ncbi:MAG: histidine phosphatase family protein [Anaerovoracaceae bacterium]|jgi:broad specificity phosphatase PhoE|nr:histidine phosphatase family protein [Anaerovoracaceae bacterium]
MLYIIRHGQTDMNKSDKMQGRQDSPLNETGLRQAREAAERIKKAGVVIDSAFSSPLKRAIETARQFVGADNIKTDERLIEMDHGPYEGMDFKNPAPEVMEFLRDPVNVPAPDGMEPLHEITRRMGSFLEDIKEQAMHSNILIATHAIALKGALEYMSPGREKNVWSKYIGNCDIYAAKVIDDGFGLPYKLEV